MSRVTRAEIAQAFRDAVPLIKSGRISWICWAVQESAGVTSLKRAAAAEAAVQIIQQRLRGNGTVEGWLMGHADVDMDDLTKENCREYRLRWVQSLIQEFSK